MQSLSYKKLLSIKNKLLRSCKICSGKGKVDNKICNCIQEFEKYVKYEYSGISQDYWDLTEKDWYSNKIALKDVQEYIEFIDNAYENGLGLILYDKKNGTGKTFLATLILKRAIEKKYKVRFIVLEEMLNVIKKSFSDKEFERFFEENIQQVDFLCIDNMGSEYRPANFGEFCKAQVDILIRYRDRNRLCTILTTNLMSNEFLDIYGNNITSLLEGKCKRIQVIGEDFRKKKSFNYDKVLKEN